MADQSLALPLNQEAAPSKSRLSGKVTFLSVLLSFSCVMLWASDKFNPAIDDATSLALRPMKQVMQPARYVMPTQRVESRNFMQPRPVFNEAQGETMGPDPNRRSILAGLAMLPMFAVADQAKAAEKLKVDDFVPYFNYEGDLAVKGKVNTEGSATQKISWDLSGMDPKCEGGPGDKPNSCGVHIHKGASCKEDALGHYFATPEDPWKTITYTSKSGKASGNNVKVTTDLTSAEVAGKTFIVHNYEGARVACGILK